jgi:hypothetical protein
MKNFNLIVIIQSVNTEDDLYPDNTLVLNFRLDFEVHIRHLIYLILIYLGRDSSSDIRVLRKETVSI